MLRQLTRGRQDLLYSHQPPISLLTGAIPRSHAYAREWWLPSDKEPPTLLRSARLSPLDRSPRDVKSLTQRGLASLSILLASLEGSQRRIVSRDSPSLLSVGFAVFYRPVSKAFRASGRDMPRSRAWVLHERAGTLTKRSAETRLRLPDREQRTLLGLSITY